MTSPSHPRQTGVGGALAGPSDAGLTLTTLGEPSLAQVAPGQPPTPLLGPGKPLALLAYLSASPGRSASREHLIDLLWADVDPDAGKHALRQTVWMIRHKVSPQLLPSGGSSGALAVATSLQVDREQFLAAIERQDFEAAAAAYTGEFLPGFAAPGGAAFEHWADAERRRLRALFVRAAETVTRRWLGMGRAREAQQLARRARDADPTAESGWRLLIEALVSGNDFVGAALEADQLEQILAAEGHDPEPATVASLRLARRSPDAAETREREFSAVLDAWKRVQGSGTARHVHVTAPAGLGKTRLLADLYHRFRAQRARVVRVRANPGERQLPYALASELAGALGRLPGSLGVSGGSASALVGLNPALSAHFPAPPDPVGGHEALRRRTIALAELATAVAEESPLVLLIDDLHWTDESSRRIIEGVLPKLERSACLVVTASRPTPSAPLESDGAARIVLAPLGEEQVGALLASLGTLPSSAWADALGPELHRATGGSPLLVLETLHLAVESGGLLLGDHGWSRGDAATLRGVLGAGSALRRRIEQLEPDARRMLLFLAVAGSPLDAGILARAAGTSATAVAEALAALEHRGVATRLGDEWSAAHDEIADRALEIAPPEERHAAASALGRALLEGADGDSRIVRRAAPLLAYGERGRALADRFAAFVRALRRAGDRTPIGQLAVDFSGGRADVRAEMLASLRWGDRLLLHPRWRAVAAVAVGAGVGVAALAVALRPLPIRPPDARFFVAPIHDSSARPRLVELRADGWRAADTLDAARDGRDTGERWSALTGATSWLPVPGDTGWIVGKATADAGVNDVFLLGRSGVQHRLSDAPGDDFPAGWSPDGRSLLMTTSRWGEYSRYDIALLDPVTRVVRPLTRHPAPEISPSWSPDGTRIAFARAHVDRPPQLCWISADGSRQRCLPSSEQAYVAGVQGWLDATQVLATLTVNDTSVYARVRIDDGQVSPIGRVETPPLVSPDGRWAACQCLAGSGGAREWLVFPSERPDLGRPLRWGGRSADSFRPRWLRDWRARSYIDRVQIVVPGGSVPLDAIVSLTLSAVDGRGAAAAVPPAVIAWRSDHADVVAVDPHTGRLAPHRLGRALIHASAGGWRRDSVWIEVVPSRARDVVAERWSDSTVAAGPYDPTLRLWRSFGVPRPSLVAGRRPGERALFIGGDSSFTSGAYSRFAFESDSGFGMEAEISTPLTAIGQWQTLQVGFATVTDAAALASWDHATGSLWDGGIDQSSGCSIASPGGEGYNSRGRFAASGAGAARMVRMDPTLQSGRWFTARVDVFPDGRCGFSIDGRAVAIVDGRIPQRRPHRLFVHGYSYDTQMRVGRLSAWIGTRGGIDWSALDRDSTAARGVAR